MQYIYMNQNPKGESMDAKQIYNINIITSENEVINLKVQGSGEESAKENLEEATNKEGDILRGAESYTVQDIELDEDLTKKMNDSLNKRKEKVRVLKENISKYMTHLKDLVDSNEEEKAKMLNGGFVFIMKKGDGQYVYGHCSKETMAKFQDEDHIYVMPLLEFGPKELGI